MRVDELETPVPVVDVDILESNISRLQNYLDEHKIANRPHIQTHKIPAIAGRYPYATLLGPMVTTLARHEDSARRLVAWLRGEVPVRLPTLTPGHVVRGGAARGVAIGGTLSLLSTLVGTPYDYDYDGAVLFVEEVGESLYRLDRLLTHLRLSSRLERVHAIVSGRLVGCSRGEAGWRGEWRRLLAEAAPQAVVVEGLPFGHGSRNLPIPLGVEVAVDTVAGAITIGGG